MPADLVRIGFTVETEAPSAGEATEKNASHDGGRGVCRTRIGSIQGIDLETYGYTLRPEYEVARDGSGTRTISGYRAQNNLRVSFPDVDAAGRILDLAVSAGANRVANLEFEASDTKAARMEALRLAVLNAQGTGRCHRVGHGGPPGNRPGGSGGSQRAKPSSSRGNHDAGLSRIHDTG